MLDETADGRTDLVFEYLAGGGTAHTTDADGVSLIRWCAYYGDVSAIKFLLARGESLDSFGDNLDLIGACFHGHWRLCKFLIERGANVNRSMPDTGESPLHSALCTTNRLRHNAVMKVLLAHGESELRDERIRGNRGLHARLPDQSRNSATPRRRFRGRRSYPTVARRGRAHRRR